MIEFYIGKASTGKTHTILKEIKDELCQEQNEKLIYLVPEQFNLQAEKDLIYKMDLKGFSNLDVLSFRWLIEKTAKAIGGIQQTEIDRLGKMMILKDIFYHEKSNLKFYKKGINHSGFINKFMDLFVDFKRNHVTEEMIKQLYEASNDQPTFQYKIHDIHRIFQRYQAYLSQDYFDDEDKFNYIISKIEETALLKDAKVYIDGFAGFNEQQLSLIQTIFDQAKDVTIALTLDPTFEEQNIFENVRNSYQKLQAIAEEQGLSYDYQIFDNFYGDPTIKFLSDNMFNYPNEVMTDAVDNIKLLTGSNYYEEIELIAMEIITLVREHGYQWDAIGIATNAFEEYLIPIKNVFTEYEIPYFIDRKKTINNNPLVVYIISLLKMIQKNFRYEDVFLHLKTGFTPLTQEEYESLENYVIEYDIKGQLWFQEFTRGKDTLQEHLDELNELREIFIQDYEPLIAQLKQKDLTVAELTKAVYSFLEQMNIYEQLQQWIDNLREEHYFEEVNENTQIWNIIINIFDQLVEIFDNQTISLKEYITILEEGFSDYEIGILPSLENEVLIGDLSRSKSHDIKALFILGVNDGVIPSQLSDNAIFSTEENELLVDHEVDLKLDDDFKIIENNYMLYSAITKPQQRLYFSYALANNEGKSLRPSLLIDRINEIIPTVDEINSISYLKDIERIVLQPKSTMKYLVDHLRKNIDGFTIDDRWYILYQWYYNNQNEELMQLLSGLFYDNQVESIGQNQAKKIYELPLKSSSTRVNSFVKCPFKHFVQYGLTPKERSEYAVDLSDLGSVYHRSLERFSVRLQQKNIAWEQLDQATIDLLLDQIINELTTDYGDELFDSNYRNKYFKKKIHRVMNRAIQTLKNHLEQGEFHPEAFEVKFKEDHGVRPIVVELDNHEKFILEGQIDRIDILKTIDETLIKVIDYKSGNAAFSLSNIYHGLDIQLMIYLNAILENASSFGFKNLKPAGVFYFKIDDPMIDYQENIDIEEKIYEQLKMQGVVIDNLEIIEKIDSAVKETSASEVMNVKLKKNGDFYKNSSVINAQDFQLLMNHVEGFVKTVGNDILKGTTKINPTEDACRYCSYKSICEFDVLFDHNEYRMLQKFKDEEVIKRLKEDSDIHAMD